MDHGQQRLTVDVARQLTFKATAPARTTEEHVYEMCCKRVRQEASQGAAQASCVVPQFIFGLPMFNRRLIRDKVALRFEREGWSVACYGQEGVLLGWGQGAKARPATQRKSAPGQGNKNGKAAGLHR